MERVDVVYALIYDDTNRKILMVGNKRENGSEWSLPGGQEKVEKLWNRQLSVRHLKKQG